MADNCPRWEVSPNDGNVENKGSGRFIFTAPEEGEVKYTVTYFDDDCKSSSTEYIVKAGDCVKCDCQKLAYTVITSNIPYGGGDYELGKVEFNTNAYCKKNTKFTVESIEGLNSININNNTGVISGKVQANSTTIERNIKFKVNIYNKVDNELIDTCEYLDKVKQSPNCECSSNPYTYTPKSDVSPVESAAQTNVTLGTISMKGNCDNSIMGVHSTGVNASELVVRMDGNSVKANISANTSNERTLSYVLTVNGSDCGSRYDITQAAGCNCDKYHFVKAANIPFQPSVSYTANLGTLSSDAGCSLSNIKFSSVNNKITNMGLNGSTLTGTVSWTQEEIDRGPSPVDLTFKLHYLDASSEACSSFTITQLGENRYCLVDNCANDDCDTNPNSNLHQLKSNGAGGGEGGCDSAHPPYSAKTYFTIGEVQYYTATKHIADNTEDAFLRDPSGGKWVSTGDWVSASMTDDCYWGDCSGGAYGEGFGIRYIVQPNPSSTDVRWARVKLYWNTGTTAGFNSWNETRTCGTGGRPSGLHFKINSWVYMMQAPSGKKFKDLGKLPDPDGRHRYVIIPDE